MIRTPQSIQNGTLDLTAVVERGAAALDAAKGRLLPVALDAKDHLAPHAADAVDRIVPLMQGAAAKARPVVTTAVTRVTEAVETEVKPRLAELLDDATRDAKLSEASRRGRATVAALRGEVAQAEDVEPKRCRCHPVLKALGLAVLIGIVAMVVRALFCSRDDGWNLDDESSETPETAPSADSAPATEAAPARDAAEDSEPTQPIQTGRRIEPEGADASAEPIEAARQAESVEPLTSDQPDQAEHADQTDEPDQDLGDPFRYGEGSFIGPNPPEGYTIKGNERSMKYHVPGALAYERCSTQVWFNSTQAAERAGFVRAER